MWSEHGVDPTTQQALLDKLESGEMVDANLGVEPVSVSSAEVGGFLEQVSTYPDGSISVSKFELGQEVDPDAVTTMGISGCSQSNYTFTNCNVNGWFTAVALAFFANYTLNGIQTARISAAWGQTVQCMFTACSPPTFEWIRQVQSGNSAAQVNLVTYWTNPIGTGTTRLTLYAKNYSAWTN